MKGILQLLISTSKTILSAWVFMLLCTLNTFNTVVLAQPCTFTGGTQHSLAIKANGTLWASGSNTYGQLGTGDGLDATTPVQVGTSTWKAVSAGFYFTVGIKTDGTLWAWGLNHVGQLGIGNTNTQPTPVQVGTDTWTAVSAGSSFVLALKSDGTLWTWGNQVHNNSQTSPVLVNVGVTFTKIDAGGYHALALTADGQLYAWGYNGYGQLGVTTTDSYWYVPLHVGNNYTAISAGTYHSLALKNNNSLWSWGRNNTYSVGDGTTTDRTSPVSIYGGSIWNSIETVGGSSLGIKNDGTLWVWGSNDVGEIGLGHRNPQPTPVQLGSATDWSGFGTGSLTSFVFKTNGTTWAAGYNSTAQLATGTITNYETSFIQSLTVCSSVLPIELQDFTATPSVKGNLLSWQTANETNNKGFEVERSPQPPKGASEKWETLGFVAAKGKAAKYDFLDAAPPLGAEGAYYRLRQIDNDGKETLSKVVSVINKGTDKLKAYPSVTNHYLTIDTKSDSDFQVINLLGQVVMIGQKPLSESWQLDVSALPKGTYILKVGVEQTKFVKQ